MCFTLIIIESLNHWQSGIRSAGAGGEDEEKGAKGGRDLNFQSRRSVSREYRLEKVKKKIERERKEVRLRRGEGDP